MGEVPEQGVSDDDYAKMYEASDRYETAKYDAAQAAADMERRAAEAEARLIATQAEVEQRRQEAANAAFREQQLAKIANGTTATQLDQYRQQKLSELVQEYPELLTVQDTDRMARENPYRFSEARRAAERANNDYLAAEYQVKMQQAALAQHQQSAFSQYAAAEDKAFWDAHPEFHDGEKGKRALQRLAEATVAELSEKTGYTREQIIHAYNSDPSFRSRAGQEASIALGRERLARQAIKEGRVRPKLPPVQKPGVAGEVRQSGSQLAALERQLSAKQSVRAAAQYLAARRRSQ